MASLKVFRQKKNVTITLCKNFNDKIQEQSFVQISFRILLFKETNFSSKDVFVVSQAFYTQGDVKISTLATWQVKFNLLVPCQLVCVVVPISIFLNFLKLIVLLLTRPLSAVHFFSCLKQINICKQVDLQQNQNNLQLLFFLFFQVRRDFILVTMHQNVITFA